MDKFFKYYNHLGFFNPYYVFTDKIKIHNSISDIIKGEKLKPQIERTALIEILTKGYALGDRTLIKGIYRTPWMAKPNEDRTQWDYFDVPKHYEKNDNIKHISLNFFKLLKAEVIEYVQSKKNIGILLSGGMDSRMVAGVLDVLIKEKELEGIKVIAYTWGKENSRDVVYAKKIAERLGWEWKHFTVTSSDLLANITKTASLGCEFSPIHLHAMLKVREEKNVDCILGGSFGDSIGRGEYSKRIVYNLKDIRFGINNKEGIFNSGLLSKDEHLINADVLKYWNIFKQDKQYQQIEQDYQIHYWRRMLNPCMAVINEKIPFYQCFSDPKLYGYMWSLNPHLRTNEIYKELLNLFLTDLSDIPWSRTGLKFDDTKGNRDKYDSQHHHYSNYINDELFYIIKKLVISKNIEQLNIFNMRTLKRIFEIMKSSYYVRDSKLESKLVWLASLSLFIEKYDVSSDSLGENTNRVMNELCSYLPYKQNAIRMVKKYYRIIQ